MYIRVLDQRFFNALLFLAAVLFLSPAAGENSPQRFQVCSMTLNSSDEINIFKQNLNPDHFEFVELVPSQYDPKASKRQGRRQRWFSSVCAEKNLKCDVLVVSGHFAGLFFGKNNYILSLTELEKTACQNSCPGVFNQLKEVYLFGCNTMAGKKNSTRTPEEYIRVLVEEHSTPQDMAERVAAGRYSVLGPTFKEKMEYVFSPQTKIYGFTDISPLGSQVRGVLQDYFFQLRSQYGSYYNYLIHDFYRQKDVQKENKYFRDTVGRISSVSQSSGMPLSHFRQKTYDKICTLYSDQASTLEKMQTVKNLFESGEGEFSFFSIQQFLANRQSQLSSSAERLLDEIKSMDDVRVKFINAYNQLNPRLVYIKSLVLNVLKSFDWVESGLYERHLNGLLSALIRKPTRQSYDTLDALFNYDKLDPSYINLDYAQMNQEREYLQNLWSILVMDIIEEQSFQFQRDLMNYCLEQKNNDPVICYQALKTLGHIGVEDKGILDVMKVFLSDNDPWLVYYATYGLAYSRTSDPYIHLEILKNIYHHSSWVRLQSLKTLNYLNLVQKGSKVENLLADLFFKETNETIKNEIQKILGRQQ